MEIQQLELTVDDILSMHRQWITWLYVEEGKTDAEIVSALFERGVVVSLSQVNKYLEDWNLRPSSSQQTQSSSSSDSYTVATAIFDQNNLAINPNLLSPFLNTPRTFNYFGNQNPNHLDLYSKRPLPTLPNTKSTTQSKTSHTSKMDQEEKKGDRLRLTCHHNGDQSHEIETRLDVLPTGPSQLQVYTEEDQSHERIAVGLGREDEENFPIVQWRRTGEGGHIRTRKDPRVRGKKREKRSKKKGEDHEGGTGKRK